MNYAFPLSTIVQTLSNAKRLNSVVQGGMKRGKRNQKKNLGGSPQIKKEEQKLEAENKDVINQILSTNRQYLEIYQNSRRWKDDDVKEKGNEEEEETKLEYLVKENRRLHEVLLKAMDNLNDIQADAHKAIDPEKTVEDEAKVTGVEDEAKDAGVEDEEDQEIPHVAEENQEIPHAAEEKGEDHLNFIIPRRMRTPRFPI